MVEDAAVTHTRHARRFVRQERLASGPFIVGEFVAHDSRPRFGNLKRALLDTINRKTHIARPLMH